MDRPPAAGISAVLFTDMVSSSELRGSLGERRADELRRHHDELIDHVVHEHAGRVLRWTGDGVKAQFDSASAAIAAAIGMQRAVARYSRSASAVAPFQIRIGLGVGEVTEEAGDIHGVCVIEAARLESLARPGEILATDLVARLGRRRADAGFEDVGPHLLKGLEESVDVVRVLDRAAGAVLPLPTTLSADRRFPLVGRTHAQAAISARWRQSCAGGTGLVLLAGQPGIGKSRLISQSAELAHSDGALVLAGSCESDLSRPYQPFATAFGDVAALDEDVATALSTGAGPLGPLFPARRSGRADDAGAGARFELFDSVVALLDRLATDQPVMVVLEDLQWASASTVQLLRHIVRESDRARVLLIGSYRIDDIDAAHPMHDVLVEVRSSTAAEKIELTALDVGDVARLVTARAPGAPDETVHAFARRIRDESAGNPFFVCELLDHLTQTGDIERLLRGGAVDRLPIPDSVRDVVGQRLSRLGSDVGNVLSLAAVVGLSFDLDLLSSLAEQPSEKVLEVLEDVARVALVHELAAGRFSFAHAIVRSTLLDAMSATRRALLHRKIAETIERLRPFDHDELAHHWDMAGVSDKANHELELAARRDLEALAYESAAERYQLLVDFHGRVGSPGHAPLARAWLGLGLARRALGMPEYLDAVVEAGRIARRLREHDLMAEATLATLWPGTFFISSGAAQVGLVELGEDALRSIAPDDPRRARLLSTVAAHLTFDADRERRISLIDEAHIHARRDGDPELIGTVLIAEYLSLWDPFTSARRLEIATEVARLARITGHTDLTFFGGFFAAIGAVERGDIDAARRCLTQLDEPIRASHNFYFGFLRERLSTSLDILTGCPDVQSAVDTLAERYAGTHADTTGTWAVQTGMLAWQRGSLGDLAPMLTGMVAEPNIASNWRAAHGLALLEAGDHDGAQAVLDDYATPTVDYFWLTTLQSYAEVCAGLDDRERAADLLRELWPHRTQLGITGSGAVCIGLVATTVGMLAVTVRRYEEAVELLGAARDRADAMSAPFESARTRRLLATALSALDRAEEASAVGAEADALIDLHGFEGERLQRTAAAHRR